MASKKVYIKTYKEFLKETVHYKVNADKINVLTYDKKGKLSEEKVFKGLTKEEAISKIKQSLEVKNEFTLTRDNYTKKFLTIQLK